MLFKLSNLNSNLALTLGYLNPALNNSALVFMPYQWITDEYKLQIVFRLLKRLDWTEVNDYKDNAKGSLYNSDTKEALNSELQTNWTTILNFKLPRLTG